MAKPPVDKAHLTSLMGEIKIMQHLGKHLNVVNLLGAVTVNLNKRKCIISGTQYFDCIKSNSTDLNSLETH